MNKLSSGGGGSEENLKVLNMTERFNRIGEKAQREDIMIQIFLVQSFKPMPTLWE
jgi:hypothetical protein